MEHNDCIYKSLSFIEQNIDKKLSVDMIADHAGYSRFHYSRVFKEMTGMTIGEYVKERRLVCAAKEIMSGKKIIDVAVQFGYETHTGFDKAFKSKFGYPPNLLYAMRLAETVFTSKGGINMDCNELFDKLVGDLDEIATNEDMRKLRKAYQFAFNAHKDQKRYSGEPYIVHPLNVAIILANMDLSIDTIILGLLHDSIEHETNASYDQVVMNFGMDVADKIEKIHELDMNKDLLEEVDLIEEQDIIFVKLADRLHNMKTLEHLDPTRWKEKAAETFEIFSPLAEKIGSTEIKLELDHLSVEYIE